MDAPPPMILATQAARSRAIRAAAFAGLAVLAVFAAIEATDTFSGWMFSWGREVAVALLVLFAAWSVGSALVRIVVGDERGTDAIVAIALGLGLLATAIFSVAVAGIISPLTLGVVVLMACVPAALNWRSLWPVAGNAGEPGAWPAWPGRIAVAVILSGGFLYASLPPVFYDTLVYHFGLPGLYLSTGSLTYWNGSYFASYPQNSEMLDVMAMAFGGEKAAQILGFGIACLVALAVRRMAKREAGTVGADLAFLFLVSQWPFWFGACFGKNDLTGALFLLAAIALALDPPSSRPLRTLALAGALAGFGVGVKLTNALPALLLGCSTALAWGAPLKERMRRPAVFLFVVLVAASPWLVRNAVHRGNPVFPAFYSVLGGRDFSPQVAARMERDTLQVMDRGPVAVARRVASLGFDRDHYASGGELSPLTMPLLVVGLVLARRRRSVVPLAIAAVTLVAGVGYLSAVVRTYAVAWVLVPLAAAAAIAKFRSKPWRVAVVVVVLAAATPEFQFSAHMLETVSGGGSRVFLGRLSPEVYVAERVNYLPMATYANTRLPADARILVVGSARTGYFRRRADAPSPLDDAWIARASQPGADPAALRTELLRMGYTHVLLNAQELGTSGAAQQATGIATDRESAVRLNRFFGSLRLVASQNECFLFEVGAV